MAKQRKGPVRLPAGKGPSEAIPARRLGGREAFFYHVHEELFGGPAALCVSARIAGPLDIQLAKHACRYLWERHPSLRARIAERDGRPSFVFDVPLRDIPVHSFFELGRTDVHTVVEREVDTLFDVSKCLWRVLLITDKGDFERHYLLLSLHHSITDGMSAVRLAAEMVLCCARILAGESPRMDPLPIRAPLEDIAVSTWPVPGAGDEVPVGGEAEGAMPFHEFQPPGRRHTRFRIHAMGPDRSTAFNEECRRRKTTAHAALAAITLMTMRKHFAGVRLLVDTSVSIRGSEGARIGDDEMWCMDIPARIEYEGTGNPGLWEIAGDCAEKLVRAASGGANPAAGHDPDPVQRIEEVRRMRHFPLSCLLIDAGHAGPGRGGPFMLESIGLVSGRQAADHIMAVSATTVGDVLSLAFAYTSPLMRESWADRFVNDFLHSLERAVK